MAQNLVVQLLLKTGAFSTDLKTARGQIQNFEKGCSTAGKSLSGFGQSLGINIGSITKFGGVVGAATLAGKEFKNIMDSSQTTADALEGAIAGCKGVVDGFRTSIASMDFSSFKNGLWDVYDAGICHCIIELIPGISLWFFHFNTHSFIKFILIELNQTIQVIKVLICYRCIVS